MDSDWLKKTQAEEPWEWTRDKKQEKKVSWTLDMTMWRQPKIMAHIMSELWEGDSLLLQRCEDRTPSKHMQELQQKTRNIISRSVPNLTLLTIVCLSVYHKAVDSFFTLFLSSRWLLRGVVAIKLLYKRTKTVFCVFVTFSSRQGYNGVWLILKA